MSFDAAGEDATSAPTENGGLGELVAGREGRTSASGDGRGRVDEGIGGGDGAGLGSTTG